MAILGRGVLSFVTLVREIAISFKIVSFKIVVRLCLPNNTGNFAMLLDLDLTSAILGVGLLLAAWLWRRR
jgi:hypothetical protein